MGRTPVVDTHHRLSELLAGDLAFRAPARDAHPLHALHPFAARFPHGLAGYFITALTSPGDVVLDPMCGSGATLLEGWASGRSVVGVDLDPLARRQSLARTTPLNPEAVRHAAEAALQRAAELYAGVGRPSEPLAAIRDDMDSQTRQFLDYWFLTETQEELAALVLSIRAEPDHDLRNLFEVVFSSTIVTKSGGVSRARDLAHTRPHRVADKSPRRPIRVFQTLIQRAADSYRAVDSGAVGYRSVIAGDSRVLPLPSNSANLVVTSPPYASALDYMRAHKFSLAWLGDPIPRLSRLRSRYIGAERQSGTASAAALTPLAASAVQLLEPVDPGKARVLSRYFVDMSAAIGEMARVLKPGSAAIIVVGPSVMRGVLIPTHDCLAEIAAQAGFDVVAVAPRTIDRDRRMMPARNAADRYAMGGMERRMHTEYIIGAVRP
jgi:DNA modification methylase